jgi:hypothetical protein
VNRPASGPWNAWPNLHLKTPDADWLTETAWRILLTAGDRAALLQRVREELVPNLEDIDHWDDEGEPGFDPIGYCLNRYEHAFKEAGDHATAEAFAKAARERASKPTRDDDDDYEDAGYTASATDTRLVPPASSGRSIFDDIDQ